MKPLFSLAIFIIAIFLLWNTAVLYPLKLLIVFFHESSHALMTLATGGQVKTLVINKMQGGYVLSSGGNRLLILSAGYIGSLIWGALIYILAIRTKYDKSVMMLLGILILVLSFFFVRDTFAVIFTAITGVFMLLLAFKATQSVNDMMLRIIGLTSMLYVPLDIYSDTIARSHLKSDAYMLADEFGGTTLLWGSLWFVLSLIILFWSIKISLKGSSRRNYPLH